MIDSDAVAEEVFKQLRIVQNGQSDNVDQLKIIKSILSNLKFEQFEKQEDAKDEE